MKSRTCIAMALFLLLGLLKFAVGGPIAEDVADALTVQRTGQHYGPYDWEFELFREDNCGMFNNGSSVFHGYGSQDMAHEGGALGFYSIKVSRVAPGCEVLFFDQPSFIQNTPGVLDSKVPKIDEHSPVGACLDRGLPTRSFQINCPATDNAKRWIDGSEPPVFKPYRYEFFSYWPTDCKVDLEDPEEHHFGDKSTGCSRLAGIGANGFKVKRIDDDCTIVLSDDVNCGSNAAGPDPKLDVLDKGTQTNTCLSRQNKAQAYTVKCNNTPAKREPQSSDPSPNVSTKQDWKLELFSNKHCDAADGGSIQTFMQVGDSTCLTDANKFGFDAVIVHGLAPGCSINFHTEESCSKGSLLSQIGTRPDPPLNICMPQARHAKAWKVNCPEEKRSLESTHTVVQRAKWPLPGYMGPAPTPMVDAPAKYSFDLFEDESCIPSDAGGPGHFQQHFEGPGDTVQCQQYGWTGNGFRGIKMQSIGSGCRIVFHEDNMCTQTVNSFSSDDPINSCRQFESMPGQPMKSIKSFLIHGCPFP